jgi:hypothetical protein
MQIKALTPREYVSEMKEKGKSMTVKTVIRRCENDQIPSGSARKVGRVWIIFVGF